MFALFLAAAAPPVIAKQINDPDCKPMMILTSGAATPRDTTGSPVQQRQRAKPQQPSRGPRPCIILANS
jgi:hypothetical protein